LVHLEVLDDFDAIEAIGDRFTNKPTPRFKTITENTVIYLNGLKLFDFNIIVD
jgi:hypothetical protein